MSDVIRKLMGTLKNNAKFDSSEVGDAVLHLVDEIDSDMDTLEWNPSEEVEEAADALDTALNAGVETQEEIPRVVETGTEEDEV